MKGTSGPEHVTTKLERIAELARQAPGMAFTTLAHHLDVAMLGRAFQRLNPHRARGAVRVTWQTYKANLATTLVA